MAAIKALEAIKSANIAIDLYTDSKYVMNGITQWIVGWKAFSLPYLYSYINIQSKKIYQVYGSPIFEIINVHTQRYLHEAFNDKI